ncbi:muscle LIM protein Mlp84B [Drosophila simulans]|uniref:Muscle LIM protein Mlp84B n=3 Tax=melanogaster subgroup TaxID=32351 RepID=MLP2_DROME|eukprot:NP_001303418.1 muscle LIM protein at 84B, isoform C [Drosophila melanogaster]
MPSFQPIEAPKCPRCGKSVYAAEERLAGGYVFHKNCFKCGMCNKSLDSTNCTEHERELYCKTCHGRKFGPKGYGFGTGAGTLSMDNGSQFLRENGDVPSVRNGARLEPRAIARAPEGEGCPRCGGYVYAAEQMLARGRSWHKECFKCGTCKKGLDSILCCEAPDKNIYCKGCYAKKFGPKGYGYGQGGGALQSDCYAHDDGAPQIRAAIDVDKIQARPGEGCPRCGGVVYAAEQKLSKGREWHKKCFNCKDCHKTLDSINASDGPDRDVYCRTCYGKKWGPHGYGFACGSGFLQTDGLTEDQISANRPFYNPDTTSIKARDGEGCPRCGGAVFAAEQQLSKGKVWHKKCYNCADCHRPLDSVLACDGPDGDIHCRACYGKLFGPKGFGYGHAPTLVSTSGESTIQFPDGRPLAGPKTSGGCPRCGFAVFAAEQMISKTRIWHKRCFYCSDCRKSLDSTNLNDGPDGDIYCRACYGRNFGPKGVGYGLGAGALTTF